MTNKRLVGQKIICLNRKASFNYYFEEFYEAGIVLKGSEVKSLREGKGSIADSYALDNNGEIFLINSHIPLYRQSSYNNHNPKSERKLLLKKKEINKLIGKVNQEGLTLIPTKMYFLKGKAKIQIAVAKGKKLYDKRAVKKKRDWNREKARLFSRNNK
jgi:SsrA-binding protein